MWSPRVTLARTVPVSVQRVTPGVGAEASERFSSIWSPLGDRNGRDDGEGVFL